MHLRVDRNLVLLLAVLLAVMLLAAANRRARSDDRGGFGSFVVSVTVSPVQRGLVSVSRRVGGFFNVFGEIRRLHTENKRLRERVDLLSQRVNRLNEKSLENARLREMLGFRDAFAAESAEMLPSTVIGMNPTNWFNSIIIDRGSNDGVRAKLPVVTARGLVGQVRLVTPETATVLLITDLNSGVGGRIQRTGWNGVVKGMAGTQLQMLYLPKDADVRRGDRVVTSGVGSVFRVKGIPIGTVERVRLDVNTSVKVATIRPAVDVRRVQEVFVLKP